MTDIAAAAPAAIPSAPTTPAAPAQGTPAGPPSTSAVSAAAIQIARDQQRAEYQAENPGAAAGGEPAAPAAKPAEAKAPAEATEAKPDAAADKNSPTERIAALTAANREARAAAKALESRIAEVEARATTTAKEAQQLADLRAAFKKDPLAAFEALGEDWKDIVDRVANGGQPLTPEQKAAADAKAAEDAREARLKKLEEERAAERTEAQQREEAAQAEGARAYVATHMITAEKYPKLAAMAEEAADEAIIQVDLALKSAFEQGKRSSPHPVDLDESMRLTHAALSGLNEFYSSLVTKLSGSQSAAQQQAVPATPAAPATASAPAVSLIDQAKSQQRGPETLTNAVAARLPPATQTRNLSADEARSRAIEMASQLPPLF